MCYFVAFQSENIPIETEYFQSLFVVNLVYENNNMRMQCTALTLIL